MFFESWFLNVILITIAIGLVAFTNKVFAERQYDQRFSAMILWSILAILATLYVMYSGFSTLDTKSIILISMWGAGSYFYSIVMMTALRYLPTSTYFVSVRLLSSFILLGIGIFFFADKISNLDIFGFIFGVIAMLLLFEKEAREGLDYKMGAVWLLLGVITLVGTHVITKMFSAPESAATVILIMSFTAFITSVVFGINRIKSNRKYFFEIFSVNIFTAVLSMIYFIGLLNVYNSGDLSISYKIQSYSPFIPIILAALVYKEKISTRKKVALALVAISLWFFA